MFLHILKVQTLVTHPNVSLVPKNRVFMFLKVHTPSLIDFLGRLECFVILKAQNDDILCLYHAKTCLVEYDI